MTQLSKSLNIERLGLADYDETLQLQRRYHTELVAGERDDTLIVCSHNPVVTLGTSSKDEHVLAPLDLFESRGIRVTKVERGGSITYHGPEQVVAYPILNLTHHKRDVGWYMRSLEEVILLTLSEFGIRGVRIPGKAGVWIDERTKIAFCGVKLSRWCSFHGLSLNVHHCAEPFSLIDPCGLGTIRVISMAELSPTSLTVETVADRLIARFSEVFGYTGRLQEN
jgi:lipoate-protein ligase B